MVEEGEEKKAILKVVGNLRFPYPKNLRFLRTLNIIKKAIPKAFAKVRADEIEGVGLHPLRCLV